MQQHDQIRLVDLAKKLGLSGKELRKFVLKFAWVWNPEKTTDGYWAVHYLDAAGIVDYFRRNKKSIPG